MLTLKICSLWIWSCWFDERVVMNAVGHSFEIQTGDRTVHLEWSSRPYYRSDSDTYPAASSTTFRDFIRPQHEIFSRSWGTAEDYRWLGFCLEPSWEQAPGDKTYDCWFTGAGVPYWFMCTVAALPGLLWVRQRCRAVLQKTTGCCSTCGYDLRATPDRCPECGTVVGKAGQGQ